MKNTPFSFLAKYVLAGIFFLSLAATHVRAANPDEKKTRAVDTVEQLRGVPDRLLFSQNGKWGVKDLSGNVIIEALYREITYLRGDSKVLSCRIGTDSILIRNCETGEFLSNLTFKNVCPFYEGMAVFTQDYVLWGFLDTNGDVVIEAQWNAVENFIDGIAKVVKVEEKDRRRLTQIPISIFPTPGKCGYIDKKDEYVIPLEYSTIRGFWGEKYAAFTKGTYVCDANYFSDCGDNPFPGAKWGIMDTTGKIIIPDDTYDFFYREGESNCFFVEKDGKLGYYDVEKGFIAPLGSIDTPEDLYRQLKRIE